jgi:hypothetical protein
MPTKLLAVAAQVGSAKKRSWSESSSLDGSAMKNELLNPKPLAVADKFIFDEHNGGGRRRKNRHVSRLESRCQITSF